MAKQQHQQTKAPAATSPIKATTVTTTKPQLPAVPTAQEQALLDKMRGDAGKGVSTRAQDNIVPRLTVLQALSPQVLLKNAAYIEGATAGDFYAPSLPEPVIDGEAGLYFQPSLMYMEWVEWVPRDQGGGFADRHKATRDDLPPPGATPKPREGRRPQAYRMGKNDLQLTRYVPGHVWEDGTATPLVINFSGTGHTVARSWNTAMKRMVNGIIPAAFSGLYRLTTRIKKNNFGEWYQIEFGPVIRLADLNTGKANPDAEVIVHDCIKAYELGSALHDAFLDETKTAELDTHNDQQQQGGDGDDEAM